MSEIIPINITEAAVGQLVEPVHQGHRGQWEATGRIYRVAERLKNGKTRCDLPYNIGIRDLHPTCMVRVVPPPVEGF